MSDSPGPVVMKQTWSDLLFLHWQVPEATLRSLVPSGLEIDRYEGRAYVGLVPFAMSGIRPIFTPPIPGLSRFLEVNVRTYVRDPGSGNRGVWFFSLDAAHRLAVSVARRFWHLAYHYARMRMDRRLTLDGSQPTITYTSARIGDPNRPAGCALTYRPIEGTRPAEPGTLDHFLVERYILYACRGTTLYHGRVAHVPYLIQSAELLDFSESLLHAAGIDRPVEAPLVHYCRGVDVRIHPIRRLRRGIPSTLNDGDRSCQSRIPNPTSRPT